MLFISSMGASEGQLVPKDRITEMWHMLARRDDQVFSREFLLFDADEFGGFEALFYKTEIRCRHTRNFVETFDRLMAMAINCAIMKQLLEVLRAIGHLSTYYLRTAN